MKMDRHCVQCISMYSSSVFNYKSLYIFFLIYSFAHKPWPHGHKLAALNAVLVRNTVLNLLAGPLPPLQRSFPRKYTPRQKARQKITSFPREEIRGACGPTTPLCSAFFFFKRWANCAPCSWVWFFVPHQVHSRHEGWDVLEIVFERNDGGWKQSVTTKVQQSSCIKPEAFICSAQYSNECLCCFLCHFISVPTCLYTPAIKRDLQVWERLFKNLFPSIWLILTMNAVWPVMDFRNKSKHYKTIHRYFISGQCWDFSTCIIQSNEHWRYTI